MSRNAVHLLCYGNLELTKEAIHSVLNQDIEVDLYVVDNGSTDGTWEWLGKNCQGFHAYRYEHNQAPTKVGNMWLHRLFKLDGYQHVLGMPNDVVLPRNFYRLLLEWPRGMVTASMTDKQIPLHAYEPVHAVSECTPMAVALVRRWFYDAMMAQSGYFFDEQYFLYASDCDLAVRMGACGLRGIQLNVPYWHEGSATLKRAPGAERRQMELLADADRELFKKKWGFAVDSWQYGAFTADLQNRGVPQSPLSADSSAAGCGSTP